MSDAVKWGILAAVIAAIFATVLGVPFISDYVKGISFISNFNTYAAEFVNALGSTFLYARQLLNNFLPADLVTITIALTLLRKPLYLIIESASMIIKAIYK